MKRIKRVGLLLMWFPLAAWSQINTDRVMLMGRNALYYEDYVLSIQRFNMVINAKPYLAEPYFYRGLAKFYLEDYIGAESDCSEAISRNPFLPDNYKLRGLCRINLKNYKGAVEDYVKLLEIEPKDEGGWHNMVLCHLELKEYSEAIAGIDQMIRYWPRKAQNYVIKAQAYFAQKDTTEAMKCLDRSLEINPYEGQAWNMRAMVYAQWGEYTKAEEALDKAIQQMPREAGLYINRALARYHQRNLRGAMDDYDAALEIDPDNYLGHFNRGLLRAQVGDDNRAIEDFDFVLDLEPDNMIALFNRALMLDNTGDYQGAIRDITAVISEYPNFWTGYQYRAEIRRKIGDIHGAEQDEFKVLKAQMDLRYGGKRPTATGKRTRKQSDRTMEDYNKLVEADSSENTTFYESEYRGQVQNRKTALGPEPIFVLTYYPKTTDFQQKIYDGRIEQVNREGLLGKKLFLTNLESALSESQIQSHFSSIAQTSEKIKLQSENASLYFIRALDEYLVQDFEKALLDVNRVIELDGQSLLGYCLRVQIQWKELGGQAAEQVQVANDVSSGSAGNFGQSRVGYQSILDDCEKILQLDQNFIYGYYNMGNVYMRLKSYSSAVEAYTHAIALDEKFAYAYYNRGVAYILNGDNIAGIADLSRAGELGLYSAYSLIKKYRETSASQSE